MSHPLDALEVHLRDVLPQLSGPWVMGRGRYEAPFAQIIGATLAPHRYWDCIWNDLYLELKLGNIWLDLVRYSEKLLQVNDGARRPVITLFLQYREARITEIYAVEDQQLLKALQLTKESAQDLLRIHREVPRSLNAQASLAPADVEAIATFTIGVV